MHAARGLATASRHPSSSSTPVLFQRHGQYESTARNLLAPPNARVLVMGTGKASQFHNAVALNFGTNIVGAVSPGKDGQTFLSKPVYGSLAKGVAESSPYAVSVFVPPHAAASAIMECIEAEVPLIVSVAEGIPTHDQLKIQAMLRQQGKSRLLGPNCPGMIIPGIKLKLGIQPLSVHSPGRIGLVSRSGTISYELAAKTSELGYGQSFVFGLGGDPFPGTRTWEALDLMLYDDTTEVICVVGEIGGQMEEEAAEVYKSYLANIAPGQIPKPVVGFIAGQSAAHGVMHGHAGAIWWEEAEKATSKIKVWEQAGFVVAKTIGDIGALIKAEVDKIDNRKLPGTKTSTEVTAYLTK